MRLFYCKRIIIFILFLLLSPGLFASANLFIEMQGEILVEGDQLKGISLHWKFDKQFSRKVLSDFDTNQNLRFEKWEEWTLYFRAFLNIRTFHYFMMMGFDNEMQPVKSIRNFTVSQRDGFVYYHFFVPFTKEIQKLDQEIKLLFFDKSAFCGFKIASSRHFNFIGQGHENYNLKFQEVLADRKVIGQKKAEKDKFPKQRDYQFDNFTVFPIKLTIIRK